MNDSFQDKIRSHLASMQEAPQPNWEERKLRWVGRVERLYEDIRSWLGPLLSDERIQIQTKETTLHEDKIGNYKIPTQFIHFGDEVLKLSPKGTLILGAAGRVDVSGPNGRAMLLVIESNDDPLNSFHWVIAHDKSSTALAPLDGSSFEQLILDLMGIGD